MEAGARLVSRSPAKATGRTVMVPNVLLARQDGNKPRQERCSHENCRQLPKSRSYSVDFANSVRATGGSSQIAAKCRNSSAKRQRNAPSDSWGALLSRRCAGSMPDRALSGGVAAQQILCGSPWERGTFVLSGWLLALLNKPNCFPFPPNGDPHPSSAAL